MTGIRRAMGLIGLALVRWWPWGASAQIVVSAETDRAEYVSRQPITLWVTFRNAGVETLGIEPPSRLGQNMTRMYYEVTEPDGVRVTRKRQYLFIDGIINPEFPGEPVAPGKRYK